MLCQWIGRQEDDGRRQIEDFYQKTPTRRLLAELAGSRGNVIESLLNEPARDAPL